MEFVLLFALLWVLAAAYFAWAAHRWVVEREFAPIEQAIRLGWGRVNKQEILEREIRDGRVSCYGEIKLVIDGERLTAWVDEEGRPICTDLILAALRLQEWGIPRRRNRGVVWAEVDGRKFRTSLDLKGKPVRTDAMLEAERSARDRESERERLRVNNMMEEPTW